MCLTLFVCEIDRRKEEAKRKKAEREAAEKAEKERKRLERQRTKDELERQRKAEEDRLEQLRLVISSLDELGCNWSVGRCGCRSYFTKARVH